MIFQLPFGYLDISNFRYLDIWLTRASSLPPYFKSRVTLDSRTRTKTTKRPTSGDDRCRFKIRLFFNHELRRWYFPRSGWGTCRHNGHCQLLPEQVKVQSSVVDRNELELIVQQLQHNIPVSCIKALLLHRTGTSLSRGQIQPLSLANINSLRDMTVVGGTSSTPAERLLQHLETTDALTYIALTGEMSLSGLITFRQTRKSRNQPTQTTEVTEGLVNSVDEDTPQAFTERLIKALSLDNGQKILLAVAWVTTEAQRYFGMFPEACGVDVTNGTNSEKRPNGRGTLLTSNNKNIPFWNSFLPSESGWVWR
jgi:hypothetical protein